MVNYCKVMKGIQFSAEIQDEHTTYSHNRTIQKRAKFFPLVLIFLRPARNSSKNANMCNARGPRHTCCRYCYMRPFLISSQVQFKYSPDGDFPEPNTVAWKPQSTSGEAAHDTGATQEPHASDEADQGQDSRGVKENCEELLRTVRSIVALGQC